MSALVIIDFDDTLFDKARWHDEVLSRSLEPFGVPADEFLATYRILRGGGQESSSWSPARQVSYLSRINKIQRLPAVAAINACADQCAPFLFTDAMDVLGRLRERFRLVILSCGDPDFQRHKFRATGIGELVDAVVVIPDHKSGAISSILKPNDNPVYFIDDKIASSLEIKDLFPLFKVVLKRRRDTSPERYQLLTFPSFDSLTEVADFVLFNSPLAKRG